MRRAEIKLLEIGIGVSGESLRMWRDYFPNGAIYGVDIRKYEKVDDERIKTFIADQGSRNDLLNLINEIGDIKFDAIIDDGSHRPDHQQQSIGYLFPLLRSGGIYVIEDLLSNGQGDAMKGAMSCDTVMNTRRLFKIYRETGEFTSPNALTDTKYLKEHIEYVNFHSPRISLQFEFQFKAKFPLKKIVHYRMDSENLCVIKKR